MAAMSNGIACPADCTCTRPAATLVAARDPFKGKGLTGIEVARPTRRLCVRKVEALPTADGGLRRPGVEEARSCALAVSTVRGPHDPAEEAAEDSPPTLNSKLMAAVTSAMSVGSFLPSATSSKSRWRPEYHMMRQRFGDFCPEWNTTGGKCAISGTSTTFTSYSLAMAFSSRSLT